jgi:hypothetical protein
MPAKIRFAAQRRSNAMEEAHRTANLSERTAPIDVQRSTETQVPSVGRGDDAAIPGSHHESGTAARSRKSTWIRQSSLDLYSERRSMFIYSLIPPRSMPVEFFLIRTSRSIPRRKQSVERFHLDRVLLQSYVSQTTGAQCQISKPTAMPRAPRTFSSD